MVVKGRTSNFCYPKWWFLIYIFEFNSPQNGGNAFHFDEHTFQMGGSTINYIVVVVLKVMGFVLDYPALQFFGSYHNFCNYSLLLLIAGAEVLVLLQGLVDFSDKNARSNRHNRVFMSYDLSLKNCRKGVVFYYSDAGPFDRMR